MNQSILSMLEEFTGSLTKSAEVEVGKTVPAKEGSRSSENTSDVKKSIQGQTPDEVEEIHSVEGAGENTPTNSIGTKATATGEGVPAVKTTKDDPGTSHPAKAGGEKYASLASLIEAGNDLLATIAVSAKSEKKAEAPAAIQAAAAKKEVKNKADKAVTDQPPASAEKAAEAATTSTDEMVSVKKAEFEAMQRDQQAWLELTGYIYGNQAVQEMVEAEKTAENGTSNDYQAQAEKIAADAMTRAVLHADELVDAVVAFSQASVKQANEGMIDPAMAGAIAPEAMAGAAPGGAPGGGDIDPETLAALLQALQAQGINPEELLAAEGAMGGGAEPAPAGDAVDAAQANMLGADAGSEGAEGTGEPSPEKKEEPEEKEEKEAHVEKLAEVFAKFVKKASQAAKQKSTKKK